MKGNRLIKIIKKYQRIYGKDPEILFRGVFGYSDLELSSLIGRDERWQDARGRAVCVIESYGQGRAYPTLALDEIERERAAGNSHSDNDVNTSHNARIQQNTSIADRFGIPEDMAAFAREAAETIINRHYLHPEEYANTQGNPN